MITIAQGKAIEQAIGPLRTALAQLKTDREALSLVTFGDGSNRFLSRWRCFWVPGAVPGGWQHTWRTRSPGN